ncbi:MULTISPECIES: hypothetical protein [unclassified Sphingomonas]|uniref:hypothetical protein n=1 Tax=unclassified Sphingomonas TaxID=196159 RepID=UPI00226A5EC5|nr:MULTISPECIES: hypothetical protein [unclassified Sphingomonas]
MLKERRQAADLVTADFLKAERAADEAATCAADCVATMLRQRADARLPVATGLDAIQLVSEATADLVRARHRLVEAHRALVTVRSDIGLGAFYAYGDESDCPPAQARSPQPVVLSAVA